MELLLLTVLFNLKKKDNEYKSYGGPFAFSEKKAGVSIYLLIMLPSCG